MIRTPRARASASAAFVLALAALVLPRAADAVEVKRVVSPAGIEAWLVEDRANPIVSLRFAFRGGAALDPAGKDGLARMVSSLLDEGAGEMNSQAFQGALEDRAISMSFDAGFDSVGGSLRALNEHRATAFRLLGLALGQPRFDPEAVERVRAQTLTQLRRDAEDPGTVSQVRLFAGLFPGHPYGRRTLGTPDSVAAIAVDDLKQFIGERFGRDQLVVGVSGDIGPDELGALLDSTFGALPAKAKPTAVADVEPTFDGGVHVIRKPVPQSSIAVAAPGLKRDDKDFYATYVMNHILGAGGFTSRLYQEVREKRGLAYSAGTSAHPMQHAALILGGAGTANARVGETLAVFRAEWKRMADEGVTEAELQDAKTYLTGSFPLRFTSTGAVAGMLVAMQIDRLGIDFLDRRNDYIRAVTQADIARVARRLLDPKKLTAVVVGEPEGIKGTN